MSEEATQTTEAPAPQTPQTPPSSQEPSQPDPSEEREAAWFENIGKRAGVLGSKTEESDTEKEPEAKAKPKKAEPKPPEPTEEETPDVHERYRERREKRETQRLQEELEARNREIEQYRRFLEEQLAEDEPEEPTPEFYKDPQKWHERRYQEIEEKIERKLTEQERRQIREQQQQRWAVEAQRAVTEELDTAEKEYESTPQGRGYRDRLTRYYEEYPKLLAASGIPEQQARMMVERSIEQMTLMAARIGKNPAAYVDEMIGLYGKLGQVIGNGSAPHGEPEVPSEIPEEAKRELEELRKASQAPEAGSLADGLSESGPQSAGDIMEVGKKRGVSVAELRRGLQAKNKLNPTGIREFLREMDGKR